MVTVVRKISEYSKLKLVDWAVIDVRVDTPRDILIAH